MCGHAAGVSVRDKESTVGSGCKVPRQADRHVHKHHAPQFRTPRGRRRDAGGLPRLVVPWEALSETGDSRAPDGHGARGDAPSMPMRPGPNKPRCHGVIGDLRHRAVSKASHLPAHCSMPVRTARRWPAPCPSQGARSGSRRAGMWDICGGSPASSRPRSEASFLSAWSPWPDSSHAYGRQVKSRPARAEGRLQTRLYL